MPRKTDARERAIWGAASPRRRAYSSAAALVAALEGARTLARLERAPAVYAALADISVKGFAS